MKLNWLLLLLLVTTLAINTAFAQDDEDEDDGDDDDSDPQNDGFPNEETPADDDEEEDPDKDAPNDIPVDSPDELEDPEESQPNRQPKDDIEEPPAPEEEPAEKPHHHVPAPHPIPLPGPLHPEAQTGGHHPPPAPPPPPPPPPRPNPVVISRGKPVTQSSDAFGGQAHLAIDGNYNQHYFGRTCTHTNHQVNPWWRIDLGQQHYVNSVKIWNRADCCGGRLNSLKVQTSDDSANWRDAGSLNQQATDGGVYTIQTHGAVGRFVRLIISKSQPEYLTLCEVEIYGSPTGGHVQPAHQPAPSGGHGHGHGGHHHHHHHRQQHHHRHHHHQPRRHHWLHHVVNFFRRG